MTNGRIVEACEAENRDCFLNAVKNGKGDMHHA